MNRLDIEERLKHAAMVAAAPRSIVDDVMRQLPLSTQSAAPMPRWDRRYFAVSLAVPTMVAVTVVFLAFFTGPTVRLTLAEIQAAVEQQAWIHIKYDAGQIEETWRNLKTGETWAKRADGAAVYINDKANLRHWYWKDSGVIQEDQPVRYGEGETPPEWTPRTAWEEIVAPFERSVASYEKAVAGTDRNSQALPPATSAQDVLNGKAVVRYDSYSADSLGKRFLYAQLWVDPKTRLPVRIGTRLQLGDREPDGKEWSTGDYNFPATGPTDLYDLGVPRTAPIIKEVTTLSKDVQPIVNGINRAHDSFLKNYRAIVWTVSMVPPETIDELDIIWRDGDKLRQNHHLPALEVQQDHAPELPQSNVAEILAWAKESDAAVKQLMTKDLEYVWSSAYIAKTEKPRVHVLQCNNVTTLDSGCWPERLQWPTRDYNVNFQLLESNADSVAGCIGLRRENGNQRSDYYIDTNNDFVCVKSFDWEKRDDEWAKTREYTLSNLRRIENKVVASKSTLITYADPVKGFRRRTVTKNIDLVPFAPADYPAGIFAPESLTSGADVIGY